MSGRPKPPPDPSFVPYQYLPNQWDTGFVGPPHSSSSLLSTVPVPNSNHTSYYGQHSHFASPGHVTPSTPITDQLSPGMYALQQQLNHVSSMHAQPVGYGVASPINYEQDFYPTSSSHVVSSTPITDQLSPGMYALQQQLNHASSMYAQPVGYGVASPVHVNYGQDFHPTSSSHVVSSIPIPHQQHPPTSTLQQQSNHASSLHAQPAGHGPAPPVNYGQHPHPTSSDPLPSPTSYPYKKCWTEQQSDPRSSQGGSSTAATKRVVLYKCGISGCKGLSFPDTPTYDKHMSKHFSQFLAKP